MTRTRFRKLSFFSYSLQHTSHDFKNKQQKDNAHGNNQSLVSWELSQPPPYAHTKSESAAVVTR